MTIDDPWMSSAAGQWFGEPWPSADLRAPVCEDDTRRVPTPVGETCTYCTQPIEPGDRGTLMLVMRYRQIPEGGLRPEPTHRECLFREVMGGPAHIRRTCTCCGGTDDPDLGMSPRQAAQWVWDHCVNSGETLSQPPEEN